MSIPEKSPVKLQISGFQSIKDLTFEFEQGSFVVLEGPSGNGKSAVRRAIQSIFHNHWDKSLRQIDSKETKIEFEFQGNKIIQTKSDKANSYEVNGNEYVKVGTDIPSEFKDIGIKKLSVEDDDFDIMVASQLDPLYMIAYKESVKSKIFNKIFSMDVQESALKMATRDLVTSKTSLNSQTSLLQEEREKLIGFETIVKELGKTKEVIESIEAIDSFRTGIASVNKLSEDIEAFDVKIWVLGKAETTINQINLINLMSNSAESLKSSQKSLDLTCATLTVSEGLLGTSEQLKGIKEYQNSHKIIESLLNTVSGIVDKIYLLETALDYAQRTDLVQKYFDSAFKLNKVDKEIETIQYKLSALLAAQGIQTKLDEVTVYLKAINKLNQYQNTLDLITDSVKRYKKVYLIAEISRLKSNIDNFNKEIKSFTNQIKLAKEKLPKICPTCGGSV